MQTRTPQILPGREGDRVDRRSAVKSRVSVVIPCLDEAETIAECVARARAVLDECGLEGEVVVVDNGSTDGSGDLARAAAQVRSRMLIIYSWDDHSVSAEGAAAFARYVRADTISVASPCGHLATGCEGARITPVVRQFLGR